MSPQLIRWSAVAAATFALLLAIHRLHFAWVHTPNVLFWDQWDIYEPLFRGGDTWALFNHQHGPHRQGLGGVLTGTLAHWTAWDVRFDAIISVTAMIAACGLGVALARRCGAGLAESLVMVPLIGLTMRQAELWIGPANPAHSPVPVMLLMAYALSWFMRAHAPRTAVQTILVALLIFTGFGIFAGALGTALFALDAILLWRAGERRGAVLSVTALLATAVVWALFFRGYVWDPAVPNFKFPHDRPLEYLGFVALMFASFAGQKGGHSLAVALPLGIALLTAVLALSAILVRRGWKSPLARQPINTALFVLVACTLLFCANTAVGRISLGWREAAYPSRYVAMLVPAIWALYFAAVRIPRPAFRFAAIGALALVAGYMELMPSNEYRRGAEGFRLCRTTWRDVYLQTGSQAAADEASRRVNGYPIHPADQARRLVILRERRLNFFAEARSAEHRADSEKR